MNQFRRSILLLLISASFLFKSSPAKGVDASTGSDTPSMHIITPRHVDSSQEDGTPFNRPAITKISADDLPVCSVLKQIHENVQFSLDKLKKQKESYPETNKKHLQGIDETMGAVLMLQGFIDQTLELLSYITIEIFNSRALAFNPEIEYRFVTTYSCIDTKYAILPRELRLLKRKIRDLNNYIISYSRKKSESLSKKDIEHLNSITQLNCRLLDCVLKDELLGIDHWDRMLDGLIYQPWEWSCKNKKSLLLMISAAAGLSFYINYLKNNSGKENNS